MTGFFRVFVEIFWEFAVVILIWEKVGFSTNGRSDRTQLREHPLSSIAGYVWFLIITEMNLRLLGAIKKFGQLKTSC